MLSIESGAERSALCRSRRELSNAYLLANFGFDTAENEPSKDCQERAHFLLPCAGRQGLWPVGCGQSPNVMLAKYFQNLASRILRCPTPLSKFCLKIQNRSLSTFTVWGGTRFFYIFLIIIIKTSHTFPHSKNLLRLLLLFLVRTGSKGVHQEKCFFFHSSSRATQLRCNQENLKRL